MKYLISALCVGLAISLTAVAYAEPATTPPAGTTTGTKTDPTPPPKKAAKPRTAKSIECSRLADEKGLKGKDRKVFRAKCKKGEPTD